MEPDHRIDALLPREIALKAEVNYTAMTWAGLFDNLIPVTLGNIIGGSGVVGLVYWFVYLRKRAPAK